MIYSLKLNDVDFDNIKSKKTKIDARIRTDDVYNLVKGDLINYSKISNSSEEFQVRVNLVTVCDSFIDLFNIFDPSDFGQPDDITIPEQIALVEDYSEKAEEEFGVVGISVELV